jgi:hypothetical protein
MSLKVLYIPGLLGSNLGYDRQADGRTRPIWLDLPTVLAGGLAWLELAPDGSSPGPSAGGRSISPAGIFAPVYAPLGLFMQALGWDVYYADYDWRLSVIAAGAALYPQVMAWAAGQPIYIVAHSQGGLVARAVYAEMVSSGFDGQLARMITLCTPHYGSLEPVRLWWRIPQIYADLVQALGWAAWLSGTPGPTYLDLVLATWPCWYELTAWLSAGPLWQAEPQQALDLYTGSWYAGANPSWSQVRANAADAVQTLLAPSIPAGRLISVAGIGQRTAYQLDPRSTPDRDDGYLYTYLGDGLVTVAQTQPPGAQSVRVYGEHAEVVLTPGVWAYLSHAVPTGT